MRNSSNTTIPKVGRGVDYVKARLARDRPDLLEQVQSGALSAHAAAITAGFRKPQDPIATIKRLASALSDEDFMTLKLWFETAR